MQHKIIFRDKALKEMLSAYWWYENEKTGLGDLLLENINSSINTLNANPNAYQLIYKKFRHIPLKKFPFVLLYKIYPGEIVIFAVFHTKRNPKNKYSK
ncbi:MAG: type II toxin-antitoxin system RelE/ParE family toxin [Bacteroidota bacterium]